MKSQKRSRSKRTVDSAPEPSEPPPRSGLLWIRVNEEDLKRVDDEARARVNEGIKYDGDKLRFDLFPPVPLMQLAQVFNVGSMKYGDRNWEQGIAWSRIFAALQRHAWAFWAREDHDAEDGILHLAKVAWGALVLLEYMQTKGELDDRPTINGAQCNRMRELLYGQEENVRTEQAQGEGSPQ